MKTKPLVSVIVAVSNNEETLYGCIESIIGQSYANLEIILMVNNSKDCINLICHNLTLMDFRIRIVNYSPDNKDNEKLSAFYEGLKHANGNYVAFVDSNDRLHKDMIRILAGICLKYKCRIACCKTGTKKDSNTRYLSERGKIRVYKRTPAFMSRKFTYDLYGKVFDIALFEDLSMSDFYMYPLYYRTEKISETERKMYFKDPEIGFNSEIKLCLDTVMKYYKDRIQYFKNSESDLLNLTHEYYCEFLGDYYIYQLKIKEDPKSLENARAEFRKEYGIVRHIKTTPFYTRMRLGLIYYLPKFYLALIKICRINNKLTMINNLKRL